MPSLSWNPPNLPSNKTAVYTWTADYAPIVHEGARVRGGGEIPARPWTRQARENLDLLKEFADQYKGTENIDQAFRGTAIAYNRQMQVEISSKVWDWPGKTKRKNGEIAGSPRDIVDTGELRNSQSLRFER